MNWSSSSFLRSAAMDNDDGGALREGRTKVRPLAAPAMRRTFRRCRGGCTCPSREEPTTKLCGGQ